MLLCAGIVSRTEFVADLSAFLPRSPTPAQQVLVDQLRDGVVSRVILIGIEDAAPETLADASRGLADQLRQAPEFSAVDNGELLRADTDRDYLWRHRYVLSPPDVQRFSAPALRTALQEQLRLLATPAGMMLQAMLPRDPGGEMLRLTDQIAGMARPQSVNGVWFSADRARALLAAHTVAAGYDLDAQQLAQAKIRTAFAATTPSGAHLAMTGPGVFSVESRELIRDDVSRLAAAASIMIALLLLTLYRSVRLLGLGLLPVASGVLAGVAAVSLGFGAVHGITLGFGITLIGEGVDYAIYLFTQRSADVSPQATLDRIWPTLRLGVLTSICGFSAMAMSGFPGLAQLGVFSIAGLVVAAAVTRWVLPGLMPREFRVEVAHRIAPTAMRALHHAPRLRWPLLAAVALSAVVLAAHRDSIWSANLASLSPVPMARQLLDQEMRAGIGAPDVRHLVVVSAGDRETALHTAEQVGLVLDQRVRGGTLQGYESPATYLPSRATQMQRQAALPPTDTVRTNLEQAMRGLPFRGDAFDPFFADLEAARRAPAFDRAALDGTRLAVKVDALLVAGNAGWTAMLPLRGVMQSADIAAAVTEAGGGAAVFLDLKQESDRLYQSYLREALTHALIGAAAIVLLLAVSLRTFPRVFSVLAPLFSAVIVTAAVLVLAGLQLSIFHLVGMLLIVAVGSNYALFFDRQAAQGADRERTVVSLLFAAVTTAIGFGLLALSSVPVLHALGATVGIGAVLALVFSAALHRPLPAQP